MEQPKLLMDAEHKVKVTICDQRQLQFVITEQAVSRQEAIKVDYECSLKLITAFAKNLEQARGTSLPYTLFLLLSIIIDRYQKK